MKTLVIKSKNGMETKIAIQGKDVWLEWWTEEGADVVCTCLCSDYKKSCKGWREEMFSPCPITSRYCG